MPEAVLDASAMMTILLGETGAARVKSISRDALVSSVNVAEAHTRLITRGVKEHIAWREIARLGCVSVPFDDDQVRMAGMLVSVTKPFGLSLGDRACLALAVQRKAKVYTTDRVWAGLGLPVEVEVIR